MYDKQFFRSRVGQAAMASIAAMAAFVALSSQIAMTKPVATVAALNMTAMA